MSENDRHTDLTEAFVALLSKCVDCMWLSIGAPAWMLGSGGEASTARSFGFGGSQARMPVNPGRIVPVSARIGG